MREEESFLVGSLFVWKRKPFLLGCKIAWKEETLFSGKAGSC